MPTAAAPPCASTHGAPDLPSLYLAAPAIAATTAAFHPAHAPTQFANAFVYYGLVQRAATVQSMGSAATPCVGPQHYPHEQLQSTLITSSGEVGPSDMGGRGAPAHMGQHSGRLCICHPAPFTLHPRPALHDRLRHRLA